MPACGFELLSLRDIGCDSADAGHASVQPEQGEFDRNIAMHPVVVRSILFKCKRSSGGQHRMIVFSKPAGRFEGEDVVIRPAQHVRLREMKQFFIPPVHQQVPALKIFEEYDSCRIIHNRLQEMVAAIAFHFRAFAFGGQSYVRGDCVGHLQLIRGAFMWRRVIQHELAQDACIQRERHECERANPFLP